MEFPRNEARWWGETRDGFGYDRSGADRLGHEQERLGAVAEAEGALRARLEESESACAGAKEQAAALAQRLAAAEAAAGQWRAMYEASISAALEEREAAGGATPPTIPQLDEVRALLRAGASGLLEEERRRLGAGNNTDALEAKLKENEAATEKLRKAAAFWKGKFEKLKAEGAAPPPPAAAGGGSAAGESEQLREEVEAAKAAGAAAATRVAELERGLAEAEARALAAESSLATAAASTPAEEGSAAASEVAALSEKLSAAEATSEKMRKAAAHWKAKHAAAAKEAAAAAQAAAEAAPAEGGSAEGGSGVAGGAGGE